MKVIKFKNDLLYVVRARSERFAVCTRKIDRKRDAKIIKRLTDQEIDGLLIYTIVDFDLKIRGVHNLLFNIFDYRLDEDCRELLEALDSGEISISKKNRIPLITEEVICTPDMKDSSIVIELLSGGALKSLSNKSKNNYN